MACPAPSSRPERGVKRAPVQPVLPVLPVLPLIPKSAKTRNAKPKPNAPVPPPIEHSGSGSKASEESTSQTEDTAVPAKVSDIASAREHQSVDAVPPAVAAAAASTNKNSTEISPQHPQHSSQQVVESDGGATCLDHDQGLLNEATGITSLSSELKGTTGSPSPGQADLLTHTDSLDQNGPVQSDMSVSSADYANCQARDTRGASVNESQVWSEDANHSSQPTSLAHDTPDPEYVSRDPTFCQADGHGHGNGNGNGNGKVLSDASHAPEVQSLEVADPAQRIQWPPASLANGTVAVSGRRSSAGSTATPHIPTLSEHLLHLANSKLWADWVLLVHSGGPQPLAIYAHGILLMRSVRLAQTMNRQTMNRQAASVASPHGGNVIDLYPPRSVFPHAFETALRFFYADTVLSSEILFPTATSSKSRTGPGNALDYLLSYWVSGIELGLEPVVTRSAHLLVELLDWDIVEATMKEAIELGSSCWHTVHPPAEVTLEYAAMALQLKQTVLNFLASQIDPNTFKLDTNPTSSLIGSRFAALEEHRARHNPALSSMVFGSMPPPTDLPASPPLQSDIARAVEETAASNILLNIDFDGMCYFYRQLRAAHGAVATSFVTAVVEERESRRSKLVSNKAIPNKQRTANTKAWDLAGYREFVEDGGIGRERVGFLLPTKSV